MLILTFSSILSNMTNCQPLRAIKTLPKSLDYSGHKLLMISTTTCGLGPIV